MTGSNSGHTVKVLLCLAVKISKLVGKVVKLSVVNTVVHVKNFAPFNRQTKKEEIVKSCEVGVKRSWSLSRYFSPTPVCYVHIPYC